MLRQIWHSSGNRVGLRHTIYVEHIPGVLQEERYQAYLDGADHPASNGAAENAVKTCKMGLTKALEDKSNAKESLTALETRFLMGYKSAVHASTGETPFKRMFNREMRTRLDAIRPDRHDHAKVVQKHLTEDTTKKQKSFEKDEKVLARDFRQARTVWAKATVKEILGKNVFVVHTIDGLKCKRHTNQLRKWFCEETEVLAPNPVPNVAPASTQPRVERAAIIQQPQQVSLAVERQRRGEKPVDRLTYKRM